jgi:hypothetical protein
MTQRMAEYENGHASSSRRWTENRRHEGKPRWPMTGWRTRDGPQGDHDGGVDFLREGIHVLAQAVMEAEVTELTGYPAASATRSTG